MPGEWSGTAAVYEASFGRLCAGSVDAVLDAVTSVPGTGGSSARSLLDVGTGPGTLARAAAARGFTTSGCDPEQSMIDLARSRDEATGSGHEPVAYALAGLPDLPYPDHAFDAVCANFVLNHTHRPRRAALELARVCGGVAAVTVWPRMRTALNTLWSGVVRDAQATTPEGVLLPPEHDFERSEAGLAALLTDAGFESARASTLEWDFAIPADQLWPAVAEGVATIGTTYLAQDEPTRQRMREAYGARTAELIASDGLLHFPTFAVLGAATSA